MVSDQKLQLQAKTGVWLSAINFLVPLFFSFTPHHTASLNDGLDFFCFY
jgi:hypothetical protein